MAGKLSWDITTTPENSALHCCGVPSKGTKSSTSFGCGKEEQVTAAGWQEGLGKSVNKSIYNQDH